GEGPVRETGKRRANLAQNPPEGTGRHPASIVRSDLAVSIATGDAPSGRRNGSKAADETFAHHACIDLNDSVRLFNKTIPEDLQIVQDSRCRECRPRGAQAQRSTHARNFHGQTTRSSTVRRFLKVPPGCDSRPVPRFSACFCPHRSI